MRLLIAAAGVPINVTGIQDMLAFNIDRPPFFE